MSSPRAAAENACTPSSRHLGLVSCLLALPPSKCGQGGCAGSWVAAPLCCSPPPNDLNPLGADCREQQQGLEPACGGRRAPAVMVHTSCAAGKGPEIRMPELDS